MIINLIQQASDEGPGIIADWAYLRKYQLLIYHPEQFGILPSIKNSNLLIILGGPMSANQPLDWLIRERKLISKAIKQNLPILGICLGAQQIAKTLGAKIEPSNKEVGWDPVYLKKPFNNLPKKLIVLHWHSESFTLPSKAQLLFSSQYLKNQGFLFKDRIVGLQFHLETKTSNLKEMLLNDGKFVQNSILKQNSQTIINTKIPKINQKILFSLLDYLITKLPKTKK